LGTDDQTYTIKTITMQDDENNTLNKDNLGLWTRPMDYSQYEY